MKKKPTGKKPMSQTENKLKFTALLETTAAKGGDMDLTVVAELFETSSHQLRIWAEHWAETKTSDVDLTAMLYETVAPETEELHVNPVTGMVELTLSKGETETMPVESFRNGLTGLNLLSLELQAAAGAVTTKVLKTVKDPDLSATELQRLASTVATIQNAFFNSSTTNIQVNTGGEGSKSLLTKFQENRKA